MLTAGTVVLTVQAPVQLEGSWVAVAWSVEALALTWLSFRLRLYELTLLSLAVFAVLALWLLFVETGADLGDYTTVLNYRMLAFASGIASLYLAALVVWRCRSDVDIVDAAHVVGGLVLAANFLTLWILSAEVIATVDDVVVDADEDTVFYTKSLALSLVWAVYASVGLVLGVVKRWRDTAPGQPRAAGAPHRQALPVRLLRAGPGIPRGRFPESGRAAAGRRPAVPALWRGDKRLPLR